MTPTTMAFTPGTRVGGYRVLRALPYDAVQGTFIELLHEATGARHIHIACSDENNVFLVAFPTLPTDDTGTPHILEHMVLNGSTRYPVRGGLFAMISRSVATSMDGWTYPGFTMYPFSTRNRRDYENLLEVYLDWVFHPLLTEVTYRQEAWRLTLKNPEDLNSSLEYGGVVFNEMKGAMAVPASRLYRAMLASLYPDLGYRFNSGGEPSAIPDLSWQQLKDFHAAHYHPSNAHFYTYGSFDLAQTLETIEARGLAGFTPLQGDWRVPEQTPFTTPKERRVPYAVAAEEDAGKAQVVVAWRVGHSFEGFEALCWAVLDRALLGTEAAPLKRALIESGLGSALSDVYGVGTHAREMLFVAGLKDVHPQDADKVQAVILETLQTIARAGLDSRAVDGVVHQLELEGREVTNANLPFGLRQGEQLMSAYLHGGDPYRALQLESDLKRLHEARQTGRILEELIQTQLLNNPHRVTMVLEPDPSLAHNEAATERTRLEQIRAGLSAADLQRIADEARALEAVQSAEQDLSSLPTLHLTDVIVDVPVVQKRTVALGGVTTALYEQPTNGLFYLSFVADFSHLSAREQDLLPAFGFALTRAAAGSGDHLGLAGRIQAYTGGLSADLVVRLKAQPPQALGTWWTLTMKALQRHASEALDVFADVLTTPIFERGHLKTLLAAYCAELEAGIVTRGTQYAQRAAASALGPCGALRERQFGITQIRLARTLAGLQGQALDDLTQEFHALAKRLFNAPTVRACVTAQAADLEALAQRGAALESLLLRRTVIAQPEALPTEPQRIAPTPRAYSAAVNVAYNALVFAVPPSDHPDAPVLSALAEYLRSRYTYKEIREKGGAYGGWAYAFEQSGLFVLGAYRDPHIERTYAVFEAAGEFMRQPISPEALREAIISASGNHDPLRAPDQKGIEDLLSDLDGYTPQQRTAFRQRLLAVTADDLRRVADTYLRDGARASISSLDKLEAANAATGGTFLIEAL